jgi:hypothetical protein
MRCASVALAICILSAVSFETAAQRPVPLEEIEVGAQAQCPATEVLDQLIGGKGGSSLGFGHTFVVTKAPPVFQGASKDSPPIEIRPGIFDRVILFGRAGGLTRRILVSWTQGRARHCGFMRAEDLLIRDKAEIETDFLLGPEPLMVGDIDPDERHSVLTLKAVGARANIQAFETPDRSVVHQTLGLFEVYTIHERKRGISPASARNDWYYLIGREGRGEDQVFGWVHADDVYLWNSRLAVSWAGTGKGRGWLDERMTGEPFLTEAAGYTEPADRALRRYPVITQVPSTRLAHDAAAKLPPTAIALDYDRLISRYLVAIPGVTCMRRETDTGRCTSATDTGDLRRQLPENSDALRYADILLLIDGTESMDAYFPSAVEAIKTFAAEMPGREDRAKPTIRIAAATYGDYLTSRPSDGIFYRSLAPFEDISHDQPRGLKHLASFRSSAAADPVNKDRLDAPFAALIQAASRTPWSARAGIRVIVHIAAHGNREEGRTSGERSTLVETAKIGSVIAELNSRGIVYVPIAVVGRPDRTDDRNTQARDAFLRQAAEIKAATGGGEVIRAYSDTRRQETAEQRRAVILQALHGVVSISVEASRLLDARELCTRRPDHARCKEPGSAGPHREAVAYVWVRPVEQGDRGEVSTLNYYVALNERSLDESRAVSFLCAQMKPDNPGLAVDFLDQLSKFMSGPAQQKVRTSELAGTRLSLPVLEKNPALNVRIAVIERAVRTKDEAVLKKLRLPYCKSSYLLELVRAGRRIPLDKIRQDPATGLITPMVAPQRYSWQVKTDRGEAYWYVPITYLPQ